jgi:hypothetical protein
MINSTAYSHLGKEFTKPWGRESQYQEEFQGDDADSWV